MVVIVAPLGTNLPPTTDLAVLDRLRVCRGLAPTGRSDGLRETTAHVPVIREVVTCAEGLRLELTPGRDHMHSLWHAPLDVSHKIGVEAELKYGAALGRPG